MKIRVLQLNKETNEIKGLKFHNSVHSSLKAHQDDGRHIHLTNIHQILPLLLQTT